MSYEEMSKELEDIIARLESGNLSLDVASSLFDRGLELTKKMYKEIDKVKGKVTIIKEELGKLTEENMGD